MSDDIFDFSDEMFQNKPKKDSKKEIEDFVKDLFDEMDNMSDEDIKNKRDYALLLEEYLSMFHKTVEDDYSDIVPISFSISDDIDKQIEILKDCINQAIPIEKSSLYPSLFDGYVIEETKKGF